MEKADNHDKTGLMVSPDRENGIYRQGETVYFAVSAKGLSPEIAINYEIQRGCGELIQSGKASAGSRIGIKADRPGFFCIILTHEALHAEAAVGVDPLLIKPFLPPPPDFNAFWNKKLAELAKVPISSVLMKIASPDEKTYQEWNSASPVFGKTTPRPFMQIDVFEVESRILEGNPARGYVAYPKGAATGSLPAVLFTHGSGFYDSDLMKTCAAAQHGFLAMDINAHGLRIGQAKEYYDRTAEEFKKSGESFCRKGRKSKDTIYLAQMYLRHRRALDFLCSRREWNRRDLIVRGCSQGGTLALACGGLDSRVTCICAGVPSVCDATRPYLLKKWFLNADDDQSDITEVREASRYVSVDNFVPNMKAKAYFTVGFLDTSCPPESVYAAYNAYGGPKKIFNGVALGHSEIPSAIQYDDFSRFMMGLDRDK